MLPRIFKKNLANAGIRNPIFFSQRSHRGNGMVSSIRATNFSDLILGENSIVTIFSNWLLVASSFFVSIGRIFCGCGQKKMIWIYAFSIVALVANTKSGWDFTKMFFPGSSMGFFVFPSRNINSSIAVAIYGTSELNTLIHMDMI